MSLVSTITSMVTPMIVDRIAATLGINSSLVRTGINMALPMIIGAFATKAAAPGGAAALQSAMGQVNPNLFGSLDAMLSGGQKDSFMESSNSMMGSLLGSGVANQLVSSLGSKAGLGGGAAAALVPLVSQMALSGLSKSTSGMDASGIAKLLGDEAKGLGLPNLQAPSMPAAPSGGGIGKWIGLAAAAVVGFIGYNYLSGSKPEVPTAQVTAAAAAINIDGVDVNKSLGDVFTGLTSTLGGVTDAATATAAVPKLQELASSVDKVAGVAGKFSPEQKTVVAGIINTALPVAKAAADKALAANGVGDLLKPVVDGLFAKLEGMAK
jgi:hypothetical protein